MNIDPEVLVIGAGPAGTASAILLARAGWRVALMEQHRYPRQKVCGECISAANLALLDELGVGPEFQRLSGPEIRQVGWMSATRTIVADMPACVDGPYRFGRALGRDRLDSLLLECARGAGVQVFQPARVRRVFGEAGRFECEYEDLSDESPIPGVSRTLRVRVVIDAHGSWEKRPVFAVPGTGAARRVPPLRSDLLAFKATFKGARLPAGLLPVFAFDGGYGGMVVTDCGRTTIACCIRRDSLEKCRGLTPGRSAAAAIDAYLRRSFRDLSDALQNAQPDGPWLSVAPVRPGIRLGTSRCTLRVGNAFGETHPLVGEGIGMALQSAALMVHCLTQVPAKEFSVSYSTEVQRLYAAAWDREFAQRLKIAKAYAHIAMSPRFAAATGMILNRLPRLLTLSAQLVGKARRAGRPGSMMKEMI
jgi:2-polyprenyl-6-methoxyphenol hydroxylase-like FAD-dependent oxidoreductase